MEEIKELIYSFVEALATVIDERTPYNGTHTRKVAEYSELLANQINKEYERKKDSIINNDVSSDLLFFSEYVKSYTNRYDSPVDSCKQR